MTPFTVPEAGTPSLPRGQSREGDDALGRPFLAVAADGRDADEIVIDDEALEDMAGGVRADARAGDPVAAVGGARVDAVAGGARL